MGQRIGRGPWMALALVALAFSLSGCVVLNALLSLGGLFMQGPFEYAGTAYAVGEYAYALAAEGQTPDEVVEERLRGVTVANTGGERSIATLTSQVVTDEVLAERQAVRLAQAGPPTAVAGLAGAGGAEAPGPLAAADRPRVSVPHTPHALDTRVMNRPRVADSARAPGPAADAPRVVRPAPERPVVAVVQTPQQAEPEAAEALSRPGAGPVPMRVLAPTIRLAVRAPSPPAPAVSVGHGPEGEGVRAIQASVVDDQGHRLRLRMTPDAAQDGWTLRLPVSSRAMPRAG